MTNYLEFDEKGITVVHCMKCPVIVATRQDGVLVHMSHSKRYRVSLADGTYADYILCTDCLNNVSEADHSDLFDKAKWGWTREIDWKFNESEKKVDRDSYKDFKKRFDIKDHEDKIPQRVLDGLFTGKEIVNKGSEI